MILTSRDLPKVALLDIPECPSRRSARTDPLQQEQRILDLEVARCAALALWSCSRSTRSRASIYRAGAVPLLAKLIRQNREELLEPVVGLVQECAVEVSRATDAQASGDRQTYGLTDGRTDRRAERQTSTRTHRHTDGRTDNTDG